MLHGQITYKVLDGSWTKDVHQLAEQNPIMQTVRREKRRKGKVCKYIVYAREATWNDPQRAHLIGAMCQKPVIYFYYFVGRA